ncbi:catecholate siderophore receptor Fiu [Cellvibrio sp. pealriver]|uniref:catecholate siderophore receptor Fiu n=1 Tax=Cellvibrio sp. pealriver TaxID=1622269 RepID=UPI00066FE3E7|nr:catecholate siderophore receptor Fiu [Cellvibrio sp. pealriver]
MTILKSSKHIVSKKRASSLAMTATALSSAVLLASTGVMAADESQSTKKLNTVKVEADALSDYKAEKVSSPKFTQPLVDTPQTIVVVKKELFQQQSATTLSEALRNTPGITMLMGENGNTSTGDSIFMRGFDTQGSIYVDGIRDLGSISRDTFNTEQVEIAKGPAGVDNGRGAASGYVNLSSKLANQEDAISGTVTGGTADYKRATVDVNRTLGESTALRVNLMKQDAGVDGRDEVESNFQGLAASLGLGLGTDTRTYINILSMEQSGIPDGGIPTIGLDGYYNAIFATGALKGQTPERVDSENFYGSTSDFNDVKANMVTVRIEQDLAEGITLRNTSRYGRTNQDQVLTGVNAITFATPANSESWTISRSRQGKDQTNQILTNQTNLTASFDAGGVKHDLVSGIEFIYESQLNYTMSMPFTSSTSSTTVSQVNANLYNPSTRDVFQPVRRTGAKTDGETTTYAFYAQDTITLNDQWELSAGVRADRFHTKTDVITRQAAVTAPAVQTIPVGTLVASDAQLTDELFGWKLGGVYKPTANGSVYVSYATSELPPGGANFALNTTNAANNINNPNLDPQKGTNAEVGTKWNVLDNTLFLTAALFRSTNENEIATNPDGSSVAMGEKQVEGLELGAVGSLTDKWQISAGLAFMDNEITRGNRTVDDPTTTTNEASGNNEGGAIQWSPEMTFTLWNTYTFESGLQIGGGARYVDTMVSSSTVNPLAQSTRSMLEFGDYWVFDAMASYPINNNLTVQLNVLNITDEDYVGSLNNGGSRYYPGQPLSARLGINFSF